VAGRLLALGGELALELGDAFGALAARGGQIPRVAVSPSD
jgi:hypothetical protein